MWPLSSFTVPPQDFRTDISRKSPVWTSPVRTSPIRTFPRCAVPPTQDFRTDISRTDLSRTDLSRTDLSSPHSATMPPRKRFPYGYLPYGNLPYGPLPYGPLPYGPSCCAATQDFRTDLSASLLCRHARFPYGSLRMPHFEEQIASCQDLDAGTDCSIYTPSPNIATMSPSLPV